MRNVRTAMIVVIGLAAVAVGFILVNKASKITDRHAVAANPIELRCRSIRVSSSDGTAHRVTFRLTNRSAKKIAWVEVMYRTDLSGAYHQQFKNIAPHARQSHTENMRWRKGESVRVRCEDYIVVYSDGSQWRAPFDR